VKKQIGLTVVVWEIVLLVAVVLVALGICKVAYPEPAQPAFGATTDQVYSAAKGTVLVIQGWITDHGRDRIRGYWYTVADYATYGSQEGRTVRCWHKGLFKPSNNCHVVVVSTVADSGEVMVVSTRIDEEAPKKPIDVRKR
jgi:hypothetical protein